MLERNALIETLDRELDGKYKSFAKLFTADVDNFLALLDALGDVNALPKKHLLTRADVIYSILREDLDVYNVPIRMIADTHDMIVQEQEDLG